MSHSNVGPPISYRLYVNRLSSAMALNPWVHIISVTFEIIFSNISRCRELQDQMARLIEQQNTIDPEMVALQQAMQGSDINQSRTSQSEVSSISQLDCRICFESDNEKVCLPVSYELFSIFRIIGNLVHVKLFSLKTISLSW